MTSDRLLPCPFCGDIMMWGDDAAGDPVFFHEQTDVLGATCFLRHMLFVAERAEAWNTRSSQERGRP
jgi:hypothetical protein